MKRFLLLMLIFTLSVAVLAACGSDNKSSQSAENKTSEGTTTTQQGVGDAEKIFAANCSTCHGGNLQGGAGPKLADIGSRLSKDQILSVIQNGKGFMAPNIIKGEEADAVAAWLADKK